jgi:hypothetical protein
MRFSMSFASPYLLNIRYSDAIIIMQEPTQAKLTQIVYLIRVRQRKVVVVSEF